MGLGVLTLAVTYFPAGSSIIGPAVLTAVFGMGTGVAPRVWPPTKARRSLVKTGGLWFNEERGSRKRDPRLSGRTPFLVSCWTHSCPTVSSRAGRRPVKVAKLSTVSTGNLKASRPVQLRPINRVVYPGSLGGQAPREPSSWHRLHA